MDERLNNFLISVGGWITAPKCAIMVPSVHLCRGVCNHFITQLHTNADEITQRITVWQCQEPNCTVSHSNIVQLYEYKIVIVITDM